MRFKVGMAIVALVASAATMGVARAAVILFADDFSNGAPDAPVSINAPDPQGNPETVADNTSVSGAVLASFGPDQRPWAGDNAGGGHLGGEVGGIASWGPASTGAASGTISSTYDFATNNLVMLSREFTVDLRQVDPIAGGGGTSGNWVGVSMFRPLPANGAGTDVNNAAAGFGVLFRDNGQLQVFSGGVNVLGDTVFDAAPTDETYDITINITNISGFGPGNSFDYDVIVDGTSITNGTRTGVNTTNSFVSVETRSGSSTIGHFAVLSVPEPNTLFLTTIALSLYLGVPRRFHQ